MRDWRTKFMAVSRLDLFDKYLSGYEYNFGDGENQQKEFTDQGFVNYLLKLTPSTINMYVGTTLHEVIEKNNGKPLNGDILHTNKNGSWLIKIQSDFELSYPQAREVSFTKYFNGIPLFGKIDALDATTVHDLKFTSKFDLDTYLKSWQWRIYLCMTGLEKFIYDLVLVEIIKGNSATDTNTVLVKGYQRLPLYAYVNMEAEVTEKVTHYWDHLAKLKPLIVETARANNIKLWGI